MPKFNPTFREGELEREIAIRGLSQEEFAIKAGLDVASVRKAIRGKRLRPKTWGKVQIALGALPVPELPASLEEQRA
jgi:transcriptional regulator with XRE-family HTH domain